MSNLIQISETLGRQIEQIEEKLETMKKAKPSQKGQMANKYQKQCKRVKNLLQTYQFTIQDSMEQPSIKTHQSQFKQFKNRIEKVENGIQFNRTAGISQEELFKHRNQNQKGNKQNGRAEMIQLGDKTQKEGKDALIRIGQNVAQMNDMADNVNIELDRQINQLDKMYDDLKDTDTTLKRAQKHLKYFARQIYTDRLMICLIVLIVIAIIVIIILSAIGKTPKALKDQIN